MKPIQVVLIEDHDLTRIGLRTALQQLNGVEVIGDVATATAGLELMKLIQPDVAVIDIGLPDMDGIELIRQFRESQTTQDTISTRILILTMQEKADAVLAAFAAGADSYCIKDVSMQRLTEALYVTAEGNSWIDPMIANIVLNHVRDRSNFFQEGQKRIEIDAIRPEMEDLLQASPLTEREVEILQLIVDGYSNPAIANHLFISLGTVKTHVRNILTKLCADDRTQAAVLGLRAGLVS